MSQVITARLARNDAQPWGFRLQGGKDFGTPLVIQKVSLIDFMRQLNCCAALRQFNFDLSIARVTTFWWSAVKNGGIKAVNRSAIVKRRKFCGLKSSVNDQIYVTRATTAEETFRNRERLLRFFRQLRGSLTTVSALILSFWLKVMTSGIIQGISRYRRRPVAGKTSVYDEVGMAIYKKRNLDELEGIKCASKWSHVV